MRCLYPTPKACLDGFETQRGAGYRLSGNLSRAQGRQVFRSSFSANPQTLALGATDTKSSSPNSSKHLSLRFVDLRVFHSARGQGAEIAHLG